MSLYLGFMNPDRLDHLDHLDRHGRLDRLDRQLTGAAKCNLAV